MGRSKLTPTELYEKKLKSLRKKRDYHAKKELEFNKKMDELEGDKKLINFILGEYIVIDKSFTGGFKEYFNVKSWKRISRGVELSGKGFRMTKFGVYVDNHYPLSWEDGNIPIIITKEEFENQFEKYLEQTRNLIIEKSE